MYLERVQKKHKGKTYTSVLLRQNVRIGKKVVRRTICSLTYLPPDLQQLIEQYLKEKKGIGGKEVNSSVLGIEERGTKEYGASGVLWALARELGLDRMIFSRKERWREDALALVVGRVVYQGSKLSLTEVEEDSVLWELAGGDGSAPVDPSSRVVAGEAVPGVQDDPVHASATTDLFDLAGVSLPPLQGRFART